MIAVDEISKERDIIRRFKIILIDDEDEDDIFPVTMERLQQTLDSFDDHERVQEYIRRFIGYDGEPEDDDSIQKDYGISDSDFRDLKDKVYIRLNSPPKMSIITGRIFKSEHV